MRDIVLLLGVFAIFAAGWLIMKRLDVFLARNAQEIQKNATNDEKVLRIAFSRSMAARAAARALESRCKAHPNAEIYLYTADADMLLAQLYGGRLGAAMIPHETVGEKAPEYDMTDFWLSQAPWS